MGKKPSLPAVDPLAATITRHARNLLVPCPEAIGELRDAVRQLMLTEAEADKELQRPALTPRQVRILHCGILKLKEGPRCAPSRDFDIDENELEELRLLFRSIYREP